MGGHGPPQIEIGAGPGEPKYLFSTLAYIDQNVGGGRTPSHEYIYIKVMTHESWHSATPFPVFLSILPEGMPLFFLKNVADNVFNIKIIFFILFLSDLDMFLNYSSL